MVTLDRPEIRKWCTERGIASNKNDFLYYASNNLVARMDFPEAYRIPYMVRFLWTILQEKDPEGIYLFPAEMMLWIHTTGIWNEQDDDVGPRQMSLLRLGLGQTSDLHERPGHVFTRAEEADCIGMSVLPFVYGWDAYLIPADGRCFAYISHDEYVEVGFPDASLVPALQKELQYLGGAEIITGRGV